MNRNAAPQPVAALRTRPHRGARPPLDRGRIHTIYPRSGGLAQIALVGTYAPTICGIASFTAALRSGVAAAGSRPPPDVVRVVDGSDVPVASAEVVYSFTPDQPSEVLAAAAALSRYSSVLLQHEFGLYGMNDGHAAVDLVQATTAPVIVTLHTVMGHPSPGQREIVETLSRDAARIVVLSTAARQFLSESYRVDLSRVEVIPHGARSAPPAGRVLGARRAPLVFTWGLLGPGKGLERAIQAMTILRQRHPRTRLVISGRTHPKVLEREGESYRHSLEELVHHLGLDRHVRFIDQFVSREAIDRLLARASVVVLPYDSTEQTSSGVLAEAITAGVPVVATAFPQALEMEAEGAVITVPHGAPDRIAAAVAGLIENPVLAAEMVQSQRAVSGASSWEVVGARYLQLVEKVSAGAAA